MSRRARSALLLAVLAALLASASATGQPDPPETSITSGPSGTVGSSSATFEFSSSDPDSAFECQLDGGGFSACSSGVTYSGLGDGSHTFEVRATSGGGETDPTPASRTWTVDTTAPETTLTSAPSGTVSTASATFQFTSSEPGSFQCRVDGGGFSGCSSPALYTVGDGTHTFDVRAVDGVGNTDASPASATWTVDTTGPATLISAGPTGTVAVASAEFSFSSPEAGATFQCQLDGGGFSGCSSPKSYSGLGDGSHTFDVRALDGLGNPGSAASRTWTVDTTAPETTIGSGPSGVVGLSSASFEFSSSEPGSTFECRLDGGSFAACGSPASYSGLSEGVHTFSVRARDGVGNVDATPASRTWTVDTTAPDTAISSGPSGTVTTSSAAFEFSSPEPAATFQCRLDGGGWSGCSSPAPYTVSDGTHTFEVRALDAAGNADASPAARTWTVDATAPETAIDSGPSGTVASPAASFSFSSSEAGSSFQCRLDGGSFAACGSPASYSGLSDRSHTFEVRAVDGAGNTDASPASQTWTVDTTAPETTISSGPSGTATSRTASFEFSSSEGSASFECRLDALAFAPCTSPTAYTGLTDGLHTFAVRASDAVGNVDSTPASRTWTIDATPPVISVPGVIIAEATGPQGAPVSFSVGGADGSEALLPSAISCTHSPGATFPLGSTTVTCQTADQNGNAASASFDVIVKDTTAPVFHPPSDLTVVATSAEGIERTAQAVTAFLAGASALDLVDPQPEITSDAPDVFRLGVTRVRFVATDGAGNQAEAFGTVTVVELAPGLQPGQTIDRGPDRLPPSDPGNAAAKPGPDLVVLSWRNPPDADFSHVEIYRSEQLDGALRTTLARTEVLVYRGRGTSFKDRHVKGGVQYRYTLVSFDKAGNRSLGAVILVVPRVSFLVAPREGARLSKPPVLRWKRVPNATYFNVQLYRGTEKILSAWPTGTSFALPRSWRYERRLHRLSRGVYRWYVWPGLGSRADARYGAMMGERTFRITMTQAKPGKRTR